MHPDDMDSLVLIEGDWIRVSSETGAIEITVTASAGGRTGIVTIPHGWGSRIFDVNRPGHFDKWGENRNRLVSNKPIDPLSQIPLLNMTRVNIERIDTPAELTDADAAETMAVAQ